MSKYQAYPEYIEIKNNFIGTLPSGWVLSKLKYEIDYVEGPGILATDFHDIGVPLLRIQNIKGRFTTGDIKTYLDPRKVKDKWEHFKVLSGDLLISGSASTDLITEVTEPYEGAVPYTGLIRLRAKKERTDKHYIRYFVQSELFKNQIDNLKTGSTIQHFGPIHLQQIVYPSSSIEQQQQIAAFLDHETAKIDTLIEKQQQLIELLKEKRQAVISHAVTKGLNPNAPMKDSGVEWLGEVPEHWNLPKLIHITTNIGDGLHSTPKYQDNTGYFFVNGNNLVNGKITIGATAKEVPESEYHNHYIHLDSSTVFLSINGTIGNVAKYNNEQIILGKSAAYINCTDTISPDYLMLLLRTNEYRRYFDLEVTGTTISNLSLNSIRQMKVCTPTFEEQTEIVKYCHSNEHKYNLLIESAQSAINLMRERRTALISAAVTGKIDVRHWVAPTTSIDTNEAAQEVTA